MEAPQPRCFFIAPAEVKLWTPLEKKEGIAPQSHEAAPKPRGLFNA